MTEYFELGRILKPQGIKGEVKVSAFTDSLERFDYLEFVYFKTDDKYEKIDIEKSRVDHAHAYLKIVGIENRDMAEPLRGKYIYIDRKNAAELPPGAYYISDLMGMKVLCAGEEIGKIEDILQTGSRDVYIIKLCKGGLLMFPSVDGVIISRDINAGEMLINAEKLEEVAVYDI